MILTKKEMIPALLNDADLIRQGLNKPNTDSGICIDPNVNPNQFTTELESCEANLTDRKQLELF